MREYFFDKKILFQKKDQSICRMENDWEQAAMMANTLLNENNWSKASYSYLLAIFLFEKNHGVATDEVIKLCK